MVRLGVREEVEEEVGCVSLAPSVLRALRRRLTP